MSRTEIISRLKSNQPQLTIGTLTTEDQPAAIQTLVSGGISLLHIDIMDGIIWSKTTVGPDFVASLDTDLIKDVHLLTDKPETHIPSYCQAGAGTISFSVEYTEDIGACLTLIEQGGENILRGVSLNPNTPLETIQPYLDQIDFVMVLAIGPDTGGETFFESIPAKVAQLREWKPELLITIDGAIKKNNVGEVSKMGSDLIATGSAVFDGVDPTGNITEMKASIASAQ
ncbi:MAG: ribulose-phosphate 3-epimerase [Roseibacillus sp.]